MSNYHDATHFKRRKLMCASSGSQLSVVSNMDMLLPVFTSLDYYTKPSISELMSTEIAEKNYCSRVNDFTVGRLGYGHVKFFGETDVRHLNLEEIVTFSRHEVVVYGDETKKPAVGQGLNKAAAVTLVPVLDELKLDKLVKLLKTTTERQGAHFISFDASSGEWSFSVQHFSRFGLTEEDEEDIIMNDAVLLEPSEPSKHVLKSEVENQVSPDEAALSHSLPSHLGLDPLMVQEMRMLMFPVEDKEEIPSSQLDGKISNSSSNAKNYYKQVYSHKPREKPGFSHIRKSPLALVEYMNSSDIVPQRNILMTGQNKGLHISTVRVEGFKLNTTLRLQSRKVTLAI